ncbi:MAG: hypothetical protein K8T89_08790 [Planctomycetes bacterium]|nr:hypothetical protein [Planctomycetota bacterium]
MFTLLLCSQLLAADPAPKKELFAKEDWYTGQKGAEKEFTGVLKYNPPPKGTVGFGRVNPYRLVFNNDPKEFREVYVGGKDELLKEYADKRVKFVGKAVDMNVEGRAHLEIWPARVELLPPGAPKKDEKPPVKVDPKS